MHKSITDRALFKLYVQRRMEDLKFSLKEMERGKADLEKPPTQKNVDQASNFPRTSNPLVTLVTQPSLSALRPSHPKRLNASKSNHTTDSPSQGSPKHSPISFHKNARDNPKSHASPRPLNPTPILHTNRTL